MYYGSGTVGRIMQAGSRLTLLHMDLLHVHSADGSTVLCEMTSCRHLESMTSYQKSDSIIRCVFRPTWRTILPNFIPIRFETIEPFFEERRPVEKKKKKINSSWSKKMAATESGRKNYKRKTMSVKNGNQSSNAWKQSEKVKLFR